MISTKIKLILSDLIWTHLKSIFPQTVRHCYIRVAATKSEFCNLSIAKTYKTNTSEDWHDEVGIGMERCQNLHSLILTYNHLFSTCIIF